MKYPGIELSYEGLKGIRRISSRLENFILIDIERFAPEYDDETAEKLAQKTASILMSAFVASGIAEGINTDLVKEGLIWVIRKWLIKGFYVFRINPRQVSYNDRKLVNVYRYGFGSFDVQYFGNDLISASLEGQTGSLVPPYGFVKGIRIGDFDFSINDIRLSVAYLKLIELETFFRESPPRLLCCFLERIYYGFMIDFGYTMDANNPFNIGYRMTLNLHPNRYWYGDLLFTKFKDFDLEVAENVSKLSEKPFNFFTWE